MPRVSSKLLANRLKFAVEAVGFRVARSWNDVGGIQLAQEYGGVQLQVVSNEHGGVYTIGPRMRATDMADALQIVSDLVYRAKTVKDYTSPPRGILDLGHGDEHSRGALSIRNLKKTLAPLGLTIRLRDGEYRVNFKGGHEATAYYTNDAQDALHTARAMAREGDQHVRKNPSRRRRTRKNFRVNPSDRAAADSALYAKFGSKYEALSPRKKSALIADIVSFALHEHVTDPDEAATLLHKRIHGTKNLESYARTLLATGPARTGMR